MALRYLEDLRAAGLAGGVSQELFLEWLDLMGAQRHLKAVGIFARLWHRDGKPQYLDDIPRTLGYVRQVSARYRELEPLGDLVDRILIDRVGEDGGPAGGRTAVETRAAPGTGLRRAP